MVVSPDKIHDTSLPLRERMEALVRLKQQEITQALAAVDTVGFRTDSWTRGDNGGGGQSMVLQNGTTFEKVVSTFQLYMANCQHKQFKG